MSYSSDGKKPFELASKSSHSHIINDSYVKDFLGDCSLPPVNIDIDFTKLPNVFSLSEENIDNIKHVIAFDGGFSDVIVRKEFPSATFAFIQIGALFFDMADLKALDEAPFISPEDMSKLRNIDRMKLVVPTKVITLKDCDSFVSSYRYAIYKFFKEEFIGGLETIKWLIYEEFLGKNAVDQWVLSSCPKCLEKSIILKKVDMAPEYTFTCPHCNEKIYITDILRLHEGVDEETGASGTVKLLGTSVEQIIMFSCIKGLLESKNPSVLKNVLFIKDGPLAFFDKTANLHRPARSLIDFLEKTYTFYCVGLEKSGEFVDHAKLISKKMLCNTYMILDNSYIYSYILPRRDNTAPYGGTTYYSAKVIFKSSEERLYVATIPTPKAKVSYAKKDIKNLDKILTLLTYLKTDMYDNALLPIALTNKLISISDHPSTELLKKFAQSALKK